MPSTASFIRTSEALLQQCRQKNLHHLSDQYGHGFQALLVELTKQVQKFTSPSEVSNLVNASTNPDGSMRSVFDNATARRIEEALDLPMCCLDVSDWHFQNNLEYFWQYAARAADDRKYFDGLLHRLLEVPSHSTSKATTPAATKLALKIDWTAIRERLKQKQSSEGKTDSTA